MLGGAREKIQTIVELAEELYERVTELREEVDRLRGTVEDTNERMAGLEEELTAQRELLEAIADDAGIEREQADGDGGEPGVTRQG